MFYYLLKLDYHPLSNVGIHNSPTAKAYQIGVRVKVGVVAGQALKGELAHKTSPLQDFQC